jgi:stage III sporulation protein AH
VRLLSFSSGATGVRLWRRVNWKVVFYLVLLGLLLYYVGTKWSDFALSFSKGGSVPASAEADGGSDFFVEFRLDREKTHKEQVDMVRAVMNDSRASKEARDAAHAQYLFLVDTMGKELKIEGLLKAKGYDSLAFLSPDACTVAVRATSLGERDVAQIGEAVRKVTRLGLEKITVFSCP